MADPVNARSNSNKLKRRAGSNELGKPEEKRAKTMPKMSKGPRIPVRSTLASRSNTASSTSNSNVNKRFSNVSISSNTSTSSARSNSSASAKPKERINPKRKPVIPANKVYPKWDSRSRMSDIQNQLEQTGGKVTEIEQLTNEVQETVDSTDSLLQEELRQIEELEKTRQEKQERHKGAIQKIKDKFSDKNRVLIEANEKHRAEMEAFEKEMGTLKTQHGIKSAAIEAEEREKSILIETDKKMASMFTEVDAELRMQKMKFESSKSVLERHKAITKELDETFKHKTAVIKEVKKKLFGHEQERRQLHETIQELKGNIRVFCRVRPAINEKDEQNLTVIKYSGEDHEKMELFEQVSSTLGKNSTKIHPFSFDKVFSSEATQHDCFDEISQLVQSALDGYNVCIFAYGQTGSGKTFTMQGPPTPTEETIGMIPRAVQQIYDVAQELKQFGWNYSMEGQFLEIYNETVHDLLGNASSFGKVKHEIHHENNGKTAVTNMSTVTLDSPSKVKMMLRKASQNRATGATNLNERSSRSHSVFTLRLIGKNEQTNESTVGILNLIDLAGSERLSASGSVGDRLRETQAINKSLSCLGDVIHALVNKKEGGHIPYRNSKLTWLLRNSLGGNCKTLMFVNVSPLVEHFGETLCSLRFATKVNSCQIGNGQKKAVPNKQQQQQNDQ